MIGLILCIETICVACALRWVLISKSIYVSFVKYGFMLILLQSLVHVFQSVCSVVIVLLAVLYGGTNSSTGRWLEGRSSMVWQLYRSMVCLKGRCLYWLVSS